MNYNLLEENTTMLPVHSTMLGDREHLDVLSPEERNQITFYNELATTYLFEFVEAKNIITGPLYNPFDGGDKFEKVLKKPRSSNDDLNKEWLEENIPVKSGDVFLLAHYDNQAIKLPMSLFLKFSRKIFFGDDVIVFDSSGRWCLFYYHEDLFFLGV